jgi:hypothetical protein
MYHTTVFRAVQGNAREEAIKPPTCSHYITEFSPAGDLVREVKMPDVYPTNICFGGPDMRTAYITLSDTGRLGMMQWPEPGLKLNFG